MSEHPVCVVTGSNGGMGSAITRTLLNEGWRVVGNGSSESPADNGDESNGFLYVAGDLRDRSTPDKIVKRAVDSFGRIDGLVYCAGFSRVRYFPEQDDAEWEDILDVNLSAAHRMSRSVAKVMLASKRGGAMVFISSIAWSNGGANPAYGAAKGGLNTLTFNIAQSLGPHGIRANAIAPGTVETDLLHRNFPGEAFALLEKASSARTPLRRIGKPQDVANVVSFLMSERASFVTGAVLPVTGGLEFLPAIGRLSEQKA